MLDLSRRRGEANTYRLLSRAWWPHLTHGAIEAQQVSDLLVFSCVCGETLGVPVCVASDFGVLLA